MTEEKEFVVKDKRIFAGDDQGELDPQQTEAADEEKREQTTGDAAAEETQDYQLPEITFPTFIFSLKDCFIGPFAHGGDRRPGYGSENKKPAPGQADHRHPGNARGENQRQPDGGGSRYAEEFSL